MRILNRYIRFTVVTMTCLVVLVILGVQAFIGFINEMRDIGGHYGVWQVFVYVFASLPHDVYPLFPAAVLIACLLGLGRLAAYSELIVMRASGVSKLQIAFSVLRATILMLVFAVFMGEWAGPVLKTFAVNYKSVAQSGVDGSARFGVWLREGDNFIHIDQVSSDGELSVIARYQFAHQRLLSASLANSGHYEDGHWVFTNIQTSHFFPDRVVVEHVDQEVWPLSFDPKLIAAASVNTDRASLWDLRRYIDYLHKSGLSANAYAFDFWKRLFLPLATLVMVGLGVPFIFGPLRSVTMGFRVLVGVVVGFSFYTFNEFLGPFTLVYQVPPVWSAAAPIILFGGISAILWWRVQ